MATIGNWLKESPESHQIASLTSEGGLYIPIETVEEMADTFDNWGTQNFHYSFFRDGYAKFCIAATIEVYVEYEDLGKTIRRTFVGACNFDTASIYPNKHFLATAKSECVKNALSDIGKKFGRGLNSSVVPQKINEEAATGGVSMVSSVDEINPEGYVK